jgi:integrase
LLVDEARERGIPGLGLRVGGPCESRALALFKQLSKMFRWLVAKRRLRASPVVGVEPLRASRARDCVLTEAEVRAFWRAASAERREFAVAHKLLLLTGQRLSEVAGMRRSELSEDLPAWTIPGERTKNGLTHAVPLPAPARDLVASCLDEGRDLVFTTNGRGPVELGATKIKRRLDARMGVTSWRLHDLRRTAATMMAEMGVAPHIVEAILNHASGHKGGVAGIYNRAAYEPEKRRALDAWARYVELIIDDEMWAAHRARLQCGGDRAREAFVAAIREGGARWGLYLGGIAAPAKNVVAIRARA